MQTEVCTCKVHSYLKGGTLLLHLMSDGSGIASIGKHDAALNFIRFRLLVVLLKAIKKFLCYNKIKQKTLLLLVNGFISLFMYYRISKKYVRTFY